jgi:Secretion system C-terminal sorting domain
MNIKYVSALLLSTVLAFGLLGNKNGRASSQGKGNTGAPGDELNANGTPKTCVNCHNAGPITATMGIHLLELDGDTVTTYQPNTDYILRVNVDGVGTTITGYGFQMIGLRNSNNTDVKGMSDFGGVTANNYKIATIQNGRTYAEHSNTSQKDTFNVRWKSPLAGTGAITFYASGNAVNGNNGTGGDGAATATLVLTEENTSNAEETLQTVSAVQVYPNPAREEGTLRFFTATEQAYQVQVTDLWGRVVWSLQQTFAAGAQELPLPMTNWAAGIYMVRVSDGKTAASVKVLKI